MFQILAEVQIAFFRPSISISNSQVIMFYCPKAYFKFPCDSVSLPQGLFRISYSVLSEPALGKAAAVPNEAFQRPLLIYIVAENSWQKKRSSCFILIYDIS